jgi:hypothetical protein
MRASRSPALAPLASASASVTSARPVAVFHARTSERVESATRL